MLQFDSTQAIEKFYSEMKAGENYLCAAYLIGNILLEPTYDLNKVKQKIISKEIKIQDLWKCIVNIPKDELVFQSENNRCCLAAFKSWIIEDIALLKCIGEENLIQLGSEGVYSRKVLLALIQNFNTENNAVFIDFNYALISQGSAEQTYLYVRPIINQCAKLPIEIIKLLGTCSPKIAKDILYDLPPEHKDTAEIAEFFYSLHTELKPEIIFEKKNASASSSLGSRLYNFFLFLWARIKSAIFYFFKSTHPDKPIAPTFAVEPDKILINPVIIQIEEVLNNDTEKNRTNNRTPSRHN